MSDLAVPGTLRFTGELETLVRGKNGTPFVPYKRLLCPGVRTQPGAINGARKRSSGGNQQQASGTMMSETNTVGTSSESMDDSARKAERYAHGIDIVAELRARAMKAKQDASSQAFDASARDYEYLAANKRGMCEAYKKVIQWLDELSGCNAANTDETRGRRA